MRMCLEVTWRNQLLSLYHEFEESPILYLDTGATNTQWFPDTSAPTITSTRINGSKECLGIGPSSTTLYATTRVVRPIGMRLPTCRFIPHSEVNPGLWLYKWLSSSALHLDLQLVSTGTLQYPHVWVSKTCAVPAYDLITTVSSWTLAMHAPGGGWVAPP